MGEFLQNLEHEYTRLLSTEKLTNFAIDLFTGNDTVPISMWSAEGISSTKCRSIISLEYFKTVHAWQPTISPSANSIAHV